MRIIMFCRSVYDTRNHAHHHEDALAPEIYARSLHIYEHTAHSARGWKCMCANTGTCVWPINHIATRLITHKYANVPCAEFCRRPAAATNSESSAIVTTEHTQSECYEMFRIPMRVCSACVKKHMFCEACVCYCYHKINASSDSKIVVVVLSFGSTLRRDMLHVDNAKRTFRKQQEQTHKHANEHAQRE